MPNRTPILLPLHRTAADAEAFARVVHADEVVSGKPDSYPLPWCEALDAPYWQINFTLCLEAPGWRERQSRKDMREIIPWIDEMIAKGALRAAVERGAGR